MRVTYSLALAILAVAVTSAGRIPTKSDDEISNNHRDIPNLINKWFHNQRNRPIDHRHPGSHKPHHGFKDHSKSPNFHTTRGPSTEQALNVTTEKSESENPSADTTTVISITAETELESESEASVNVVSSTELQTEDASIDPENVASTVVDVTESESEDASTATAIAVSTLKSETDEVSLTTVSADSQSIAETTTTTRAWWQRILFWQ